MKAALAFPLLGTRLLQLLQQGVQVFPLEEPVVVHRMANGCDLPALTQLRSVFGDTPKYAAASEIRR